MERLMKWLSEVFAPKAREVFANPWIDTVASTMKKVLPIVAIMSLPVRFVEKSYFWPFSHEQLQRNKRLTQNPGWTYYD